MGQGGGGFQNNKGYRCYSSSIFKATITNFGKIISPSPQTICAHAIASQSPRYPCPAELAMMFRWTRAMQTLVTRSVLTLRIRITLPYICFWVFAALCLPRNYIKNLCYPAFIAVQIPYLPLRPQFYLSFKKLKPLLH